MSPPDGRDYVTVVTGVPRSGTSMTMQMLAAGGLPVLADDHRPADVDNPRGYLELEAVKRSRQDASWVRSAVGRAVKVPHVLVPVLPGDLEYRIVLVVRRLEEVVASQRAMLARLERVGAAVSDERLVEAFARQLRELEAFLDQSPHVRWIRLDYQATLDDPGSAAVTLERFLDGGLDRRAMAAAVDAGLRRCIE